MQNNLKSETPGGENSLLRAGSTKSGIARPAGYQNVICEFAKSKRLPRNIVFNLASLHVKHFKTSQIQFYQLAILMSTYIA